MIRFFRTFLPALLIATGLLDVHSEAMEKQTLRVLTFNILHGATTRDDFDLDAVAQVIVDAKPDLVALQEVDVKTGRARGLDLAAELASRTDLASVFGPAMAFDGGEYGVAVLSALPIRSTRTVPLPHTEGSEPRVALEAVIALPSGGSLRFISTHLDFASEADRIAQAETINKTFGGRDMPAVLAGDFNATPGSETMAIFRKMWTPDDESDPPPTFPSDAPAVKIDYVMYAPEDRWSVIESRVIQDEIASDHCAYLSVLALDK